MAIQTSKKRKIQQRQAILRLLIMAAILICINMLASRFHFNIDLTKEKRFTLTHSTKHLLADMKEVAVVDIYLNGKLPSGFQHLRDATTECLKSFQNYAGNHVVYRFIDPLEGKEGKAKQVIYNQLAEKGVYPVNLHAQGDDNYSEKIIFPYVMVQYNGREIPVKLIENNPGMSPLELLNYSETTLEYKLATALHNAQMADRPRIAYMVGNGEPLGVNTLDALTTIAHFYHLDTLDITKMISIPAAYDAILIDKPLTPFDDKQKFIIDQYVMHGGHVMWMLDMMRASLDSFRTSEQFIALDYGLNLDDILFKYGVRINPDLIEDIVCNQIPSPVDPSGQVTRSLSNWIYFPVMTPTSKHPIVNNMNAVEGQFVSSIDTVTGSDIKKTVLLESSKYSRVTPAPARISLTMMRYTPQPEMFNKPYRAAAVLCEGRFKSVFQNRLAPSTLQMLNDPRVNKPFKAQCDTTNSMVIVGDGDIMLNNYSVSSGAMPLGYWHYTKDMFSNKIFLLNCIEYLTDHSGLLEARSRESKLRLLDAGRCKSEKTTWQILNTALPIALVLIFASAFMFFRKRRYEIKAK
jgi:gliding-associated putative ABC transporter substrate-binding component GldG